jgi:hypothetical protein
MRNLVTDCGIQLINKDVFFEDQTIEDFFPKDVLNLVKIAGLFMVFSCCFYVFYFIISLSLFCFVGYLDFTVMVSLYFCSVILV